MPHHDENRPMGNLRTSIVKHVHKIKATNCIREQYYAAITMIQAIGAAMPNFIDFRHHYIKEVIKTKDVHLRHVRSKKCRVDLFTKALQRQRFEKLRKTVDVAEIQGMDHDLLTS